MFPLRTDVSSELNAFGAVVLLNIDWLTGKAAGL